MHQVNVLGIISLFLMHAISMVVLFPPRVRVAKALAILSVVLLFSTAVALMILRASTSASSMAAVFSTTVLMGVLTCLMLSEYSISKSMFLFLFYAQAFMLVITMAAFLARTFFSGDLNASVVIRTVLHASLLLACVAVRNKFNLISLGITQGWWSLNIVQMLCLLYTSLFSFRVYSAPYGNLELILFFLFLTVIVANYIVFFNTIHYMYSDAQKQRAELQSEFLLDQVSTLQESMDEARRIRHDARHHNLQIVEYVKNGEKDALLRYLNEYETEAESHLSIKLCENLAADSIISAYVRKAEQNGIDVNLDIAMEQDIGIKDVDIVAILANIMENAILGCIRSGAPDRFIDVYIGKKAGKLVIYIRNTADPDMTLEDGIPKSTRGGGIGVSSILHSAFHYGGETDFQCEEGVFSSLVLLKLPHKSAPKE